MTGSGVGLAVLDIAMAAFDLAYQSTGGSFFFLLTLILVDFLTLLAMRSLIVFVIEVNAVGS
jgi:hypothetical protein